MLARSLMHLVTRSARCAVVGLVLAGCGPGLDVGSDLLWSTNHETGDLSDWYAAPGGGLLPDMSNSTVEIGLGLAHSGRYSLKFIDLATSDSEGPAIYRALSAPPDLYYSAWYYLPHLYQTNSQWTIQKFRSPSDTTATVDHGHDLNLRTLPGGQVVLYVYSHDPNYLQAPLADPPALVPIETWFQIESFYQPRTDTTGRLSVWLNDRLVYDLRNRTTASSDDVLWTACDIGEDIELAGQPVAPELYVDDAAISRVRVSRSAAPFAPK